MFTYRWNLADLKNVKPNGYTVFSCFAGGGGLVKVIKWLVLMLLDVTR